MSSLRFLMKSSVGQKLLVGLTGLGLAGFVVTHMAGNMMMFVSAEKYNIYGHGITSNPAYPLMEVGLLLLLVVHLTLAISLTRKNRAARGTGPSMRGNSDGKGSSYAARTMILTGLLVFVFVVLHLITFRFGPHYMTTYHGVEVRDLYRLIVEKFQQPTYVVWYVFSMIVLFLHLSHGVSGVFQSLGFASSRKRGLKCLAYVVAFAVAAGFASQPLVVFFSTRGN